MTAYIHHNSVVLGLCKEIGEYKYSSYSAYVQELSKINLHQEVGEVLELISSGGYGATYKDFIDNIDKAELKKIDKKLHKGGVVGSEKFKEKVNEEIKRSRQQSRNKGFQLGKRITVGIASIIAILVAANIIFYGSSRKLKKEFHALSENKEKEIREKVGLAKQKVRRSIEEQHRADNISYKVMIKRLEMEKKQREELEKKLEGK